MEAIGLSSEELRQVSHTCRGLRFPETAPWYLQDLLVGLLASERLPRLAAKVRQLNSEQIDALHESILEAQHGRLLART